MRENSEVMIIYPRVKYQFDVENPWFPQENGLQVVDFPHFLRAYPRRLRGKPTYLEWSAHDT